MKLAWALFALILAAFAAPLPAKAPIEGDFQPRSLSWEGTATVHAGGRKIEPGGKPIPQAFYFPGRQIAHGVKWPRHIQIFQHGKLFFDLKIEKLEAGAVP